MFDLFQKIVHELNGREQTDGSYICHCVAHDDTNPSLHISLKDNKILFHCFAGCSQSEIIDALRARGLWTDLPSQKTAMSHRANFSQHTPLKNSLPPGIPAEWITKDKNTGKILSKKYFKKYWTYKDEQGKIIGYVVRYEDKNGGKKEIIPFFTHKFSANEWSAGSFPGPRRPLFGLHLLPKAPKGLTIWLVEGEKCADVLQQLPEGVRRLAVTSQGGTRSPAYTDWSPLAGRKIRIWQDNDKAGQIYLDGVVAQLEGLMPPAIIEIVDIKKLGLGSGDDVFDWLQKHDPDELGKLPLIQTRKTLEEQDTFIDVTDYVLMDIPDIEMIMDPWLPTQGLCMIHAKRGAGKTLITCEIAYAVASGIKFLNWEAPKPRGVLYVDGEMSAKELQDRFVRVIANHSGQAPLKKLRLYPAGLNIHGIPNIGTPEGQARINAGITEDIELIIIDSLSVLQRGCDENKSIGWEPMQEWLLQLRGINKAVLLIHHSGKSGDQRGASKREDFMNTVISLKEHVLYSQEEGAKFEIRFEKGRNLYGPKARSIDVEFIGTDWIFKDMKGAIREQIIRALKDDISQKEIVKIFKVSQQYISKIKKETIFNGEL